MTDFSVIMNIHSHTINGCGSYHKVPNFRSVKTVMATKINILLIFLPFKNMKN